MYKFTQPNKQQRTTSRTRFDNLTATTNLQATSDALGLVRRLCKNNQPSDLGLSPNVELGDSVTLHTNKTCTSDLRSTRPRKATLQEERNLRELPRQKSARQVQMQANWILKCHRNTTKRNLHKRPSKHSASEGDLTSQEQPTGVAAQAQAPKIQRFKTRRGRANSGLEPQRRAE